MGRRFRRLIANVALALAFMAVPAAAQMTTTGAFDVDHSGIGTFSMPISVPLGTAGMIPALQLIYASQNTNGPLGIGWSLDGVSVITRCGRTLAQDGVAGAVHFDADDRFCMDGQRLMVMDGGTYGAPGTVYHTELETFSKVTAVGTAGSGPASFTVRTKSGLIMEYGVDGNSSIAIDGGATKWVWAVNKITDTVGNYMTFEYEAEPGQIRLPSKVSYTGNTAAGLTPYASVEFEYEDRADVITAYTFGQLSILSQRLKAIKTKVGTRTVMEYRLTYDVSPATHASRITQVEQCDGNSHCLPPVTMTWSGTAPGELVATADWSSVPTTTQWSADGPTDTFFQFADVNGDGRPDAVKYKPDPTGSTDTIRAYLNFDDLTFGPQKTTSVDTPTKFSRGRFFMVDLNNDTYDDMLVYNEEDGNVYVALSLGDGTFGSVSSFALLSASSKALVYDPMAQDTISYDEGSSYFLDINDYNADGKLDFSIVRLGICNRPAAAGGLGGATRILYGNGDGSFQPYTSVNFKICNSYGKDAAGVESSLLVTNVVFSDLNRDNVIDRQVFYEYRKRTGPTNGYQYCHFNLFGATETGITDPSVVFYADSVTANGVSNYKCSNAAAAVGDKRYVIASPYLDANLDGVADYWSFSALEPGIVTIGLGRGDGTFDDSAAEVVNGTPIVNPYESTDLPGPVKAFYEAALRRQSTLQDFGKYYWASVSEVSADGRPDAYGIRFIDSESDTVTSSAIVAYNYADGSFETKTTASFVNGTPDDRWVEFVDLDVDGVAELVVHTSQGYVFIAKQVGETPDRVTAFTDGLGSSVSITYSTLSNNETYIKGDSATPGQIAIKAPIPVVREIATSDGIGGVRTTRYRYNGLKVEPRGRGELGFRWVEEQQVETGVVTRTEYSQAWPYLGTVTRQTMWIPPTPGAEGEIRQRIYNGLKCLPEGTTSGQCDIAPGNVYFPYVWRRTEDAWDLNGTVMPSVITDTDYDAFGNATEIEVFTDDGFSKTTVNTYDNDTNDWILGRLRRTEVTSEAPLP